MAKKRRANGGQVTKPSPHVRNVMAAVRELGGTVDSLVQSRHIKLRFTLAGRAGSLTLSSSPGCAHRDLVLCQKLLQRHVADVERA